MTLHCNCCNRNITPPPSPGCCPSVPSHRTTIEFRGNEKCSTLWPHCQWKCYARYARQRVGPGLGDTIPRIPMPMFRLPAHVSSHHWVRRTDQTLLPTSIPTIIDLTIIHRAWILSFYRQISCPLFMYFGPCEILVSLHPDVDTQNTLTIEWIASSSVCVEYTTLAIIRPASFHKIIRYPFL